MPIEFIGGLIVGIALGIGLTIFIKNIKELKEEWRTNK